jgi:hypothetical protein
MDKPRISFEKCDKAFAESVLGLKRNYDFDSISDWLHRASSISEVEIESLKKARRTAFARIDDWNEETLKMHFISTVLNLVDFNTNQYSAFADEKIEAELDNITLTGKTDWFVASGIYKPKVPYFSFTSISVGIGQNLTPKDNCWPKWWPLGI